MPTLQFPYKRAYLYYSDPDHHPLLLAGAKEVLSLFPHLDNNQLLRVAHSLTSLLIDGAERPEEDQFPLVFNTADPNIHVQFLQFFSLFDRNVLHHVLFLQHWDLSVFAQIFNAKK